MTGKQKEAESQRRCYLSGFEEGVGAMSKGMWAAFQAGEGKITDSPLRPPEGTSPANSWMSALSDFSLRFTRTTKTVN